MDAASTDRAGHHMCLAVVPSSSFLHQTEAYLIRNMAFLEVRI